MNELKTLDASTSVKALLRIVEPARAKFGDATQSFMIETGKVDAAALFPRLLAPTELQDEALATVERDVLATMIRFRDAGVSDGLVKIYSAAVYDELRRLADIARGSADGG